MTSIRSFALRSLGLALLVSCLGAGFANAQQFRGKFTLPFAARWGQVTLPAGDYSFKTDQAQGGGLLFVYGEQMGAIVLAQSYNPKTVDHSALILAGAEGAKTVRELRLAEIGVVLYFAPHHPRHQTAAEEREIATIIPVVSHSGR